MGGRGSGRRRAISIDREHEVVSGYKSGKSTTVLAESFGVSTATIRKILDSNGVNRKRNPKCEVDIVDAIERYERGETLAEIGDVYGCSYTSIGRFLKEAGVKTRRPGLQRTTSDIEDEVCRLYADGLSNKQIAEKFGICSQEVSKIARRCGCAMHGRNSNTVRSGLSSAKKAVERFEAISESFELLEYLGGGRARVKCRECGDEFVWSRDSWDAVCPCPTCRDNALKEKAAEAAARREQQRYERVQQLEAAREWRLSVPIICKTCGEPFYSDKPGAVYCSKACARAADNKRKRKRTRRNSYRHRMRVPITPETYDRTITTDAVYKKYRGVCCNCGKKTIRTKKYHPLMATVDHIVALANNGTHTWDNVQLLCGTCNSYKRDLGQLRLAI